jgi:hypothetical protein
MGVLTSTKLVELLEQQREVRVTLPFCQRTLARWEEEFGAAHPSTARVRHNLARVLLADGRPQEALALGEAAYEMSKLVYGSNHSSTGESAQVMEACELALNDRTTHALARLRAAEAVRAASSRLSSGGHEQPDCRSLAGDRSRRVVAACGRFGEGH